MMRYTQDENTGILRHCVRRCRVWEWLLKRVQSESAKDWSLDMWLPIRMVLTPSRLGSSTTWRSAKLWLHQLINAVFLQLV
jgi:hypothetical protein